jgi:hypothetical protein
LEEGQGEPPAFLDNYALCAPNNYALCAPDNYALCAMASLRRTASGN